MKKILLPLLAAVGVPFFADAVSPSDFAHSVEITASGYAGSSALADFPVLVKVSPAIIGFKYSLFETDDYSDLAFFDEAGAELACEVDTWNPSGTSLVWVKVPSLTSATKIKMCFGSTTATRSTAATDVWTKYKAVWHMNENAVDSKSGLTLTPTGPGATTTDLLGRGYEATKREPNLLMTGLKFSNVDADKGFTVSGWFKQQFDSKTMRLFSTKKTYDKEGFELMIVNGESLYLRGDASAQTVTAMNVKPQLCPEKGTWVFLGGSIAGSNGVIWTNGCQAAYGEVEKPTGFELDTMVIGNGGSGGTTGFSADNCYVGIVDEVRVLDGAASEDWMKAECDTVSAANFLSYGPLDGDDSIPVFASAPVLTAEGESCALTFELEKGTGDIYLDATDADSGEALESRLVLEGAAAGAPITCPVSLPAGHVYSYAVRAVSASGVEIKYVSIRRVVVGEQTPDIFKTTRAGDWLGEGVWTPTATERAYPHVRGDEAQVTAAVTASANEDVVVSTLKVSGGTKIVSDGVHPATVRLQAAPEAERASFWPQGGNVYIGESTDTDLLTVSLDSPVSIYNPSTAGNNARTRTYVYAKLAGGTPEAPSPIVISKAEVQWNHAEFYLMNPANTWCGDFTLLNNVTKGSCSLNLYVGDMMTGPWYDSVFGNATNRICLYGQQVSLYLTNFDTNEGLKHGIRGTGQVACQAQERKPGWTDTYQKPLVLGNGFVADPCVENGDIGALTFKGAGITWKEGSTYRVNVAEDGKHDTVTLQPTTTSAFRGALEVVEDGEIDLGTEFVVMTVAKQSGAKEFVFTFEPSAVTEGWNAKCTGDYNSGWTVSVVKSRTGVADVVNYPMSLIAGDHATANFEVTDMGGLDELTVRSYYSTTDHGADVEAWGDQYVETVVTAKGMHSARIDGLEEGVTYYFTQAAVVDGEPVLSLSPAESCVTSDVHPESYTWVAENGDWDGDGNWTVISAYERSKPGAPEDEIRFDVVVGATRTVTLDRDASVGKINPAGGDYTSHFGVEIVSPNAATLTLDNGDDPARFVVTGAGTDRFYFGTSEQDSLVLKLAPVNVFERGADISFSCYFYGKVTGGTPDSPVSLTLRNTGVYSTVNWCLLNPENDFCADLMVETTVDQVGDRGNCLRVGDGAHPFADSMLGNAANTITIGKLSQLQPEPGAGNDSVVWSRTIRGTGTLQTGSGVALGLAASARIEPMAYGTFTVKSAAGISDAFGTRYAIDIDADNAAVSDKIAFITSSPLALAGAFEIVPDDPSVKIPIGTRWTVGSVDTAAGSVGARRIKCATPGFRIFCEGDADSGWTLFAERTPAGLLMIVK